MPDPRASVGKPEKARMCGIAGILVPDGSGVDADVLRRMTGVLSYRGPDEEGFYGDAWIGMGQRRLSIIDENGGSQPIPNEEWTIWVAFNGEIFNYPELRDSLEAKGHRFRTRSDTEVIVHAYEQWGEDFPNLLNGQFAIALWDSVRRKLLLVRDRVGIRPLVYARLGSGALLFASEAKSLFAHPALKPEIDPVGIAQIFTFWANVPPRTAFRGVEELPPGGMLSADPMGIRTSRWWRYRFPDAGDYEDKPVSHYAGRLRELLGEAVAMQVRADVHVGAYLSGGLDSSAIAALIRKCRGGSLTTLSVAFPDAGYDERVWQHRISALLGTDHRMIEADDAAIGAAFCDVVWHAERPILRTSPAPLFMLSALARRSGIKVVLTGEGSDEIFAGYALFREDKVRRFWARQPASRLRPRLLSRLYPDINRRPSGQAFWQAFFGKRLEETGHPYYSHRIRWDNTSAIKRLLSREYRSLMPSEEELYADLAAYLDPDMGRWDPLCRAQYLELELFMAGYLLNSQGDRVMMGNSVTGRFPFLDHRLIDFAAGIPPWHKIRLLEEKYVLRQACAELLPADILFRPKQPYRAPIVPCLLNGAVNRAAQLLQPESLQRYGYADKAAMGLLLGKIASQGDAQVGSRDEMAVAGIASLQLLHDFFIAGRRKE